jgi:hypothetical protein
MSRIAPAAAASREDTRLMITDPSIRSAKIGRMSSRVPFAERGGAVRGVLDLATGCYPAFLFGGPVGAQLPVFHFHDEARESLEPRLRHLAENGYRTVTCDEISRLVIDGISPGARAVALTFDDAWASVWTVAFPLLQQYGLRATVFAIPARVEDPAGWFVNWEQLRAMQASGVVDVQSHTQWHVMMFAEAAIAGFVTPEFAREPLLNRPMTSEDRGAPRFLEPDALGTPLYLRRSRMSDALRFIPNGRAEDCCREAVAHGGGASFFQRPDWQTALEAAAGAASGRQETDDERASAIQDELTQGRETLSSRLGTSVRHVALPWGIAGALTRDMLSHTGHTTAFAERPLRRRGVRAGDDRYGLMRLNGKFLTCLPGRRRQWFFTTV